MLLLYTVRSATLGSIVFRQVIRMLGEGGSPAQTYLTDTKQKLPLPPSIVFDVMLADRFVIDILTSTKDSRYFSMVFMNA